jgi:flotillin
MALCMQNLKTLRLPPSDRPRRLRRHTTAKSRRQMQPSIRARSRLKLMYTPSRRKLRVSPPNAKAYGALAGALGGPQGLMQYLMLENDTHVKLAKANGEAIRGLQPKISVWNTGAGSSNSTDAMAPIKNLMQTLPPHPRLLHSWRRLSINTRLFARRPDQLNNQTTCHTA